MTFFGHYRAGRTPPQAKPIGSEVEVEARRLYVQDRRIEAFKQNADAEDWRRWEQGRDQGKQGRLL
jgi:hypothetical protein